MSWRILHLTKPCRLSVNNTRLCYENEETGQLNIPLEDISVLVFDHQQITLNSYLLSQLSEYNIVSLFSDQTHHPNGVMFPFHNHSRYSEIAWQQVEISEPFKKRLWQEIVKAKIINQAEVLKLLNCPNADKLKNIASMVQSGDAKNSEAFAAAIYWQSLFANFTRNDESDIRNAALNYGYAVIRGCLARSVVSMGLLPCFGIHHCNKLNQFNLVDDLIEPLRPFVDYQLHEMNIADNSQLTPQIKNKLINILTQNCLYKGEEISILKSCEIMASSLSQSIRQKNIKLLILPVLKKLPLFEQGCG